MPIFQTTHAAFLILYRSLLIEHAAWTAGPKLDAYMDEIRLTVTTNQVRWTGVTELAKSAYIEIGGRRKPNLERIRDLPSGPAFLPMRLLINGEWPERERFTAWLEAHGLKPLATDRKEPSLLDGVPIEYGKPNSKAAAMIVELWRHYRNAAIVTDLAVAAQ